MMCIAIAQESDLLARLGKMGKSSSMFYQAKWYFPEYSRVGEVHCKGDGMLRSSANKQMEGWGVSVSYYVIFPLLQLPLGCTVIWQGGFCPLFQVGALGPGKVNLGLRVLGKEELDLTLVMSKRQELKGCILHFVCQIYFLRIYLNIFKKNLKK